METPLSYTWVKQALQGAGLVKSRRKRGKIASGGHCQGCCCTSMPASTVG